MCRERGEEGGQGGRQTVGPNIYRTSESGLAVCWKNRFTYVDVCRVREEEGGQSGPTSASQDPTHVKVPYNLLEEPVCSVRSRH